MYMCSAYLYLAAVALAESDGLQRFAREYVHALYMGSISVEVLMSYVRTHLHPSIIS